MTPDDSNWVPLIEGVRIIARALSGSASDRFTRAELSEAVGLVEAAGRTGTLHAEGIKYLDRQRTPLNPEDWQARQIFKNNRLDDPGRNPRHFPVRVLDVVVECADIRRIASAIVPVDAAPATIEELSATPPLPLAACRIADVNLIRQKIEQWAALRDGTERPGTKVAQQQVEKSTGQIFDRNAFREAHALVFGKAERGRPRKEK